ncbi:MAG: HDOD domain-containing protein [SAR324 cluster bacterium]|uniref:HDOD domain-containing protein n=1 Tax=SAR324 cluster bacterium TaxID=2024889 RepID=A0A7X9FRX1_9DELT|nr:HDOD domain-containing protein [SAR324 cluster bacterium]
MSKTTGGEISSEEFLNKLRQALRREGDFPASAKVVSELKALAANPNATGDQITEVILREPSLSIRILHIVNSSFYMRAQPIMTVSQAVLKMGIKPIADLCSGLILLQKFVPAARQNTPFANCLKKVIVTSILTGTITPQLNAQAGVRNEETGFLAGSFSEMGMLLLAYYFPKIYENALKRAETKHIPVNDAIQQLTGLSPLQISSEVINALNLPPFYSEVMKLAEKAGQIPKNVPAIPVERRHLMNCAKSIVAAETLTDVITEGKGQVALDKAISELQEKHGVEPSFVSSALGGLNDLYKDHCTSMQLTLPDLPEFLESYSPDKAKKTSFEASESLFDQYISEIKQAVENREPTASIIVTVMEAISSTLDLDLVLLLLATGGKQSLSGRMLIGDIPNFDPNRFVRPIDHLADPNSVEVLAFKSSRCVFSGKPLLRDGFPIVAMPIGFGKRAVGVIYAERTKGNKEPFDINQEESIRQLAELLDRSLSLAREGKFS